MREEFAHTSLLYAGEHYGSLGVNGSGLVFKSCVEALRREGYFVHTLFFGDDGGTGVADFTLPGPSHLKPLKLARALARYATGALVAPAFLEELGRAPIKEQVRHFIEAHDVKIMLLNKFDCVRFVGEDVLNGFKGIKLLDLHDDFILREAQERFVLTRLLERYPRLSSYRPYANVARKHRLSRFDEEAARDQERHFLSLFDQVLVASEQEAISYRRMYPNLVSYCPWPVSVTGERVARETRVRHQYGAGFVASDAVFNLEGLLDFIENGMPSIRADDPDFMLAVAGNICKPLMLSRAADFNWHKHGIRLLGFVKDVVEFYKSVACIIVPLLHGTGVSLKTLEAVSHGVPVLATPVGVRGLDYGMLRPLVTVVEPIQLPALLPYQATREELPALDLEQTYLDAFDAALAKAKARRHG